MRSLVPLLLFALLSPQASGAQSQPHPLYVGELNGFLLGQSRTVLAATYGKPGDVRTVDGFRNEAYFLAKGKKTYLVCEFSPKDPDRISAIQISGDDFPEMHSFLGLRLGDRKDKVVGVLGKPTSIEPETDEALDLYHFPEPANYSLEFKRDGTLFSIRIWEPTSSGNSPSSLPDLKELASALSAQDTERLLQLLDPEVEIYVGKKTISFSTAARPELTLCHTKPTPLCEQLFGGRKSLTQALTIEKSPADQQIRIYEKGGSASVAKFPSSAILSEIVFMRRRNQWQVYEIKMK